jgi:hypothetical protein
VAFEHGQPRVIVEREIGPGIEPDPPEEIAIIRGLVISAAHGVSQTVEHPFELAVFAPSGGRCPELHPLEVGKRERPARRADEPLKIRDGREHLHRKDIVSFSR